MRSQRKADCIRPVQWRQFDNAPVAHWEASGDRRATGRYVSANPRLSIFFDDMNSISTTTGTASGSLARAIFVPAGTELRTRFSKALRFTHVDIHMDYARAIQLLSGVIPRSCAIEVLENPVERDDVTDIEPLARLLVR